jgi:hypothetical protein
MKLSTLYAAIGLAFLATNAIAGTPAVTFDSLNSVILAPSHSNRGFEFQATTKTYVTALGSLTRGVGSSPVQVGLWNSDGTLLASANVTQSSATLNQFSYSSIGAVALTAGSDYYVASVGYTAYGYDPVNANTAPQIAWIQDAFNYNGGSLSWPNATDYIHTPFGWYGANFQISAAPPPAIPEPETYAMLLAGLGLIGFIAYRRKNDSSDMPMAV